MDEVLTLWNKRQEEVALDIRYPNLNFLLSVAGMSREDKLEVLRKVDENPAVLAKIYEDAP